MDIPATYSRIVRWARGNPYRVVIVAVLVFFLLILLALNIIRRGLTG